MLGRFLTLVSVGALAVSSWAEDFTLTILHTNDLHSHVEPSRVAGVSVGGYARQATAILKLREEAVNPILLNGGDTFQGTLYFTVYEGLVDLAFMNIVGYDAMCVGNHEFDKGVDPFADFVRLAKFPVLAANLDLSAEPKLKDLIKPATILEVGGEKIGIVGAVTPDLMDISSPGPTVKLKEYVPAIQREVDELTKQGVNKIVMLTHCGFGFDRSMAKEIRGVDIVGGGHSHTLLGDVGIPDFTGSRGAYPTVEKDRNGQDVLIVQCWEWGKAIGNLKVVFDDKGVVKSYEGAPVLIDESFPEDPYIAAMLAAFRKPIEKLATERVADLAVDLERSVGNDRDSLMGNVISDAMLEATKAQGSVAAFWNTGGVRASLTAGTVTYGQLIEVCPFGNTLVVLELTGAELLAALEHGTRGGGMLLPSKGFSYTYDRSAAEGSRLVSASLNGEAIDPGKSYKLTFSNFTSSGGDGHRVLAEAKGARLETGFVDIDALVNYFKANSPVKMENEGRVKSRG